MEAEVGARQIAPSPTEVRRLTSDECFSILSRATLGRIGVSHAAMPQIFPVSFAFESGSIVFRTARGGLLDRTCRNTVVAFESDDFDPFTGLGWSVLMVGVANVLSADDGLRAMQLGLVSAGAADGGVFVKIVPGTISGRAIELHHD